jgi:hypothetical protein
MIFHFLQCVCAEVDFSVWTFALEVFVRHETLHFIAKQLDFWHAVEEAAKNLCIFLAVIVDHIIYCFLDVKVAKQNFCSPDSIELVVKWKTFFVVSAHCVHGSVKEGKKQGKLIHRAK